MTKENNLEMLDMIGRDTPEDEIESLRAQLAEVTRERDEFKEAHKFTFEQYQDCGRLLNETCAQLEATHAHAARLVEAMKTVKSNLMHQRRFGTDTYQAWKNAVARAEGDIEEILDSTPINLDALHEDRARTLEEAIKDAYEAHPKDPFKGFDHLMMTVSAHRAKKEGV